jgi:hypothetical protein
VVNGIFSACEYSQYGFAFLPSELNRNRAADIRILCVILRGVYFEVASYCEPLDLKRHWATYPACEYGASTQMHWFALLDHSS